MAHNIPAKYDEENCIFIPPMRIVGFNPQLTMNDSLLAQEYVNTYDISFPEALKQIATDVESLKRHIEEERIYELLRIGKFVINGSTLEFIPEETGVITPALYGLDAINIRPRQILLRKSHSYSKSKRNYRADRNGRGRGRRNTICTHSVALHKTCGCSLHCHHLHAHDACQIGRFEQAQHQPKCYKRKLVLRDYAKRHNQWHAR